MLSLEDYPRSIVTVDSQSHVRSILPRTPHPLIPLPVGFVVARALPHPSGGWQEGPDGRLTPLYPNPEKFLPRAEFAVWPDTDGYHFGWSIEETGEQFVSGPYESEWAAHVGLREYYFRGLAIRHAQEALEYCEEYGLTLDELTQFIPDRKPVVRRQGEAL